MGQYYKALVMGKRLGIYSSWDYGSGSKLMEHSYLGNDFVNAVYTEIENNPSRIAWVGDYAEDVGLDKSWYELVWGDEWRAFKGTTVPKELFWKDEKAVGEGFLINHTKQQYIDLQEYAELARFKDCGCEWVINPLPLLTAIGNGQGGGDYHRSYENFDHVGDWFMDEIEFCIDLADGLSGKPEYDEVTEEYIFKEE